MENEYLNWIYINKDTGEAYIYDGAEWHVAGAGDIPVEWKGELGDPPINPDVNWAYYNTLTHNAYIFDGDVWQVLSGGPKGDTGDTGPAGATGPAGQDGAGIQIAGSVPLYANLPTTLTSLDAGKGFIVQDSGLLYIWDGSIFPLEIDGVEFRGPVGATGPTGDTGNQGIQGIKGDTGEKGATGDQGIQGLKGDTGDPGVKGDSGDQGIQGVKGDTGDTGPTGDQGIQGIKGDTGDQGIQGPTGATGPTGDQGIQVIKGDTGNTGPTGPAGSGGGGSLDMQHLSSWQDVADDFDSAPVGRIWTWPDYTVRVESGEVTILASGNANFPNNQTGISLIRDGKVVNFMFSKTKGSGSLTAGTAFATVPVEFRPLVNSVSTGYVGTTAHAITINASTGNVSSGSAIAASAALSFNAVWVLGE